MAQRAMDIWPNVGCVYVKAVSVKRNDYTEPSSKSYRVVKDAVADRLMLSKLAAFMSIAMQLQPYLTAFQSDNPLMPFVCGELSSIVRALMKRIVKPDILDEATSMTRLLAVKLSTRSLRTSFVRRNLTSATLPVHPRRNCCERRKSARGHCFVFEMNWLHLYVPSSARS